MTKKKATKTNKNWYFTQEVQDAIVLYNSETDNTIRNKIFRDRIHKPLCELVDNLMLVHHIKCNSELRENIRDECVSHLVCALKHFDPEMNKKAFSYFDVVAKHWLINFARKQQKQFSENEEFDDSERKTYRAELHRGQIREEASEEEEEDFELSQADIQEIKKRLLAVREQIRTSKDFFESDKNKHGRNLWKTLSAVIYLLDTSTSVPIITKKSIRAYLKEISGLKSNQLAASLKCIKPTYDIYVEERMNEHSKAN